MSKKKEVIIPDHAILLMIRHENFCAYINFKEFIEKKMKARIPIPKRVFDKFISLIEPVNNEKEIRQKYHDDAIDVTTERFSKQGYWFEFSVEEKCDIPETFEMDAEGKFRFAKRNKKNKKVVLNTRDLIESVYSSVNSKLNSDKPLLKGEVVREAYLSIQNFIKNNFETKRQIEFLSHYKCSVIATYITIKFGYKFTSTIPKNEENKEFSNQQLFDSSRAEIDKLKEQKTIEKAPKKLPKNK